MEQRGTLLSWNDDKGFGFIQPEGGGAKLFVHISAMRGDARPNQGATVFYLAGKDEQGRPRATHMRGEGLSIDQPSIRRKPRKPDAAVNARPAIGAALRRRPARKPVQGRVQSLVPKLVAWLLLCSLPLAGSLMLYSREGWFAPLAAYCGVSLVSFFMYRADKRQAQEGLQRTPENWLHLTELLGGWPGALIAQQVYRHKTRKVSYQTVFWLIIAAHQLYWADRLLLDGRYLMRLLGS